MSSLRILRVTDKWSRRSFAVKLSDDSIPKTIGTLIDMICRVGKKELDHWFAQKRITKESVAGCNDIQQAMFEIHDDGTLGGIIDGVFLTCDGLPLQYDDVPPVEIYTSEDGHSGIYLTDLIVDRDNVAYKRNWNGYYRRNWTKEHSSLVDSWMQQKFGRMSEDIFKLNTTDRIKKFINCIAGHVYRSPYEMYSRYLGRTVPFKTASETLTHIGSGRGGNCSEKASVIDYICANFGIEAHPCLSGNDAKGAFPEFHLRRALERSSTIFTGENQRYWEHFANIILIGEERWLLDATGGPMPFLFCDGSVAEEFLKQKRDVNVNFIAREEHFYYHDAPLDIVYGALFNMEVFLPDIDMYHIFGPEGEDSPFGLCIKPDLWVCPDAYREEKEFDDHCSQWNAYASQSRRINAIEVYQNLKDSDEKTLLRSVQASDPALIADLRMIEEVFVKRCRYIWRDEQWRIGYVFCNLQEKQ
ncbi:MAG: hypothetical protein JW915_11100 [Chitinispirillaceae bacterium]|nr:hypothetical protein [Chitinispirillaceae bacterium]